MDHSRATVSVIIATYNRAGYLAQCLESVLAQSRAPDEILVIDDGSNDGTRRVVEGFGNRIRYFWQPNQGRPTALNLGLENATGSHLVFFDDDDVLLAGAVKAHLDVLNAVPDADYSYSPNLAFDEHGPNDSIWDEARHKTLKHRQYADPDTLFLRTLEWGEYFLIYLQGMMIPRQYLEEVGRFQTSLLRGQDYDVMLKLAWRYRGVSTGQPTFIMRNHAGGRGPAIERHSEAERLAMWSKYDRQIVLPYRDTLPLAAYLDSVASSVCDAQLDDRQVVEAITERARVMFSHGLFDEGVANIEAIAGRREIAPDQWQNAVELVRHAANIEKPHYLPGKTALVRDLGRGRYPRGRKRALTRAAAQGLYWASRRFMRERRARQSTMLLVAAARLAARHARYIT
ncbi:glycosyltransferase family A protein [Salinisphaera sp. T31B1]|uniref:glycosyltransferase family A protein n=1 Tax=Salinisphaera sp. T31B1 TaxID=727963 RepID=UPI0033411B02